MGKGYGQIRQKIILPPVTFYADLGQRSFHISELLYGNTITHEFVFSDELFLLQVEGIRELEGFTRIRSYLTNYEYVFDSQR
jgi:hypothetical protein